MAPNQIRRSSATVSTDPQLPPEVLDSLAIALGYTSDPRKGCGTHTLSTFLPNGRAKAHWRTTSAYSWKSWNTSRVYPSSSQSDHFGLGALSLLSKQAKKIRTRGQIKTLFVACDKRPAAQHALRQV
jgi:hypothetical protein